jgi:sodium ion-translocating decarboxylase beta subunit
VTPLISALPMLSVMTAMPPSGGTGLVEHLLYGSGVWSLTPANVVMVVIALLLLSLAVARNCEPLTLVPLAFGILIGNLASPVAPIAANAWALLSDGSVLGIAYTTALTWLLPALVFLGLGATMDLSAILSRPKAALIGVVAQLGIFAAFVAALRMGAVPQVAAAIGMIGAAHGPTTLYAAGKLAPHALVPIALAAYSYLALGPMLQSVLMRLLTSRQERMIRMTPGRPVGPVEAMVLPVAGLIVTAVVVPGVLPLMGAFCLGSFLKVTAVTSQLAKTVANALLDIVTVLLGIGLGVTASAEPLLTLQVAQVFGLGIVGFAVATITGVLAAKLLNAFGDDRINPLIGAAGVCGLPGTARVVESMGLAEDPSNHLLAHTAAPGVAGLLGSALVAGLFLGLF